jgi:hypothetical protein
MHAEEGEETDRTKVIGAYRNYAKAPKNLKKRLYVSVRIICIVSHSHSHTQTL